MKITVVNAEKSPKAEAIFVTLLFEFGDGRAMVFPGWKIHDNRLYPPAKSSKGNYFHSVFVSELFAKDIQDAIVAAKIEGVDLDHDAFISSKWGQSKLKGAFADEAAAMELWRTYR